MDRDQVGKAIALGVESLSLAMKSELTIERCKEQAWCRTKKRVSLHMAPASFRAEGHSLQGLPVAFEALKQGRSLSPLWPQLLLLTCWLTVPATQACWTGSEQAGCLEEVSTGSEMVLLSLEHVYSWLRPSVSLLRSMPSTWSLLTVDWDIYIHIYFASWILILVSSWFHGEV